MVRAYLFSNRSADGFTSGEGIFQKTSWRVLIFKARI